MARVPPCTGCPRRGKYADVGEHTCAYRELNPAVKMMKSAENRPRGEVAEPLDRPMGRGILVQGQMCPKLVVIAGVGRKNPAQMSVAEDDDVIEAFPTDRADQPLRIRVLPG
jgi:hypothetical protein